MTEPHTADIESLPAEAVTAAPLFNTLALDPKLLRAVVDSGYTAMTPIQAKAIPLVLEGRDIMGAAQTGTGKTAAFTLPLLQKMLRHENASMSPARHPVPPVSWPTRWPTTSRTTPSTRTCARRWSSAVST
jgi:ATP-dependent RNA helicase RhlE